LSFFRDNASKDCQSSKKRKTDKDDKGENRTFISLDNVPLHHADPQDVGSWGSYSSSGHFFTVSFFTFNLFLWTVLLIWWRC